MQFNILKFSLRRNSTLSIESLKKSSVWLSLSNCVFENISFEDCIYENCPFNGLERVLFIWRNSPSVVIGRHQNPWKEVNLKKIEQENIKLCRRNSGGGAVYHDLGNVNMTIFSHKDQYNRRENLNFIVEFFREIYKINLEINKKDDIIFESQFKVSGSAAKVGLNTAYHHFTLLCNSDVNSLTEVLKNSLSHIQTSATQSVPSPIKNLFYESYDFFDLVKNLTDFYHTKYCKRDISEPALVHVNPVQFPIVLHKIDQLKAWDWTFGKSPKFFIHGMLMEEGLQIGDVNIVVQKGIIVETQSSMKQYDGMLKRLVGIRFDPYRITFFLKTYGINIYF